MQTPHFFSTSKYMPVFLSIKRACKRGPRLLMENCPLVDFDGKLWFCAGSSGQCHEGPFSTSECGWAGRGLLALLPTGPRENSWPWPGDLAASAHTFACPASRNRCLIICPSQGPSWERRPIMGALKSPPNWRRLSLSGQVCTYP